MEHDKPTADSHFTRCLLKHYSTDKLHGKAIKDKRGGKNNIHSWDIELKGEISIEQKELLEKLFKERRKKHWAGEIGIERMDGMPPTATQISSFYNHPHLEELLEDLVSKDYLKKEHPKDLFDVKLSDGTVVKKRLQDKTKQAGYNIVTGKLSFEFTKILDSYDIAPTLVATDISHIGVIDGDGIRNITIREGLHLFGFPEDYTLSMFENNTKGLKKAFDLSGNTVAIPVVKEVSMRVCKAYEKQIMY